jgi:hypothetical protein
MRALGERGGEGFGLRVHAVTFEVLEISDDRVRVSCEVGVERCDTFVADDDLSTALAIATAQDDPPVLVVSRAPIDGTGEGPAAHATDEQVSATFSCRDCAQPLHRAGEHPTEPAPRPESM